MDIANLMVEKGMALMIMQVVLVATVLTIAMWPWRDSKTKANKTKAKEKPGKYKARPTVVSKKSKKDKK